VKLVMPEVAPFSSGWLTVIATPLDGFDEFTVRT
jgi:hypothetical protein